MGPTLALAHPHALTSPTRLSWAPRCRPPVCSPPPSAEPPLAGPEPSGWSPARGWRGGAALLGSQQPGRLSDCRAAESRWAGCCSDEHPGQGGDRESASPGAAGCLSSCLSRRERTWGTSPQGRPAGQKHRPVVLRGPAVHPHTSRSGEDWPGSAHCLPASPRGAAVCRAQLEHIQYLKPTRPKFSRKTPTRTESAASVPPPPPLCGPGTRGPSPVSAQKHPP